MKPDVPVVRLVVCLCLVAVFVGLFANFLNEQARQDRIRETRKRIESAIPFKLKKQYRVRVREGRETLDLTIGPGTKD